MNGLRRIGIIGIGFGITTESASQHDVAVSSCSEWGRTGGGG